MILAGNNRPRGSVSIIIIIVFVSCNIVRFSRCNGNSIDIHGVETAIFIICIIIVIIICIVCTCICTILPVGIIVIITMRFVPIIEGMDINVGINVVRCTIAVKDCGIIIIKRRRHSTAVSIKKKVKNYCL